MHMTQQSFGAALGALIKQKRTVQGMTQLQLSEDAYQTPGKVRRISELESGTVANPHPKTIDPLIVALNISDEELAQCARASDHQPDKDLDDAYRNARNLIDALLYQFEHDNPDASFSEVDDFLKAKARHWRELRGRIVTLEGTETELIKLKDSANAALQGGDFKAADQFLEQAEALRQTEHTLSEISKLAAIRITRGDIKLLSGDREGALGTYIGAAEFYRAFDIDETVMTLDVIANRIYETGRRSLESDFQVASSLLAKATEIRVEQGQQQSAAQFKYKAALILRNQALKESRDRASELVDRAISLNREAETVLTQGEDQFFATTTQINLANCLMDKGKLLGGEAGQAYFVEAIAVFETLLAREGFEREFPELACHASNNLGTAHLAKSKPSDPDELSAALAAFKRAISLSAKANEPDIWAAAQVNSGNVLASLSDLTEPANEKAFLRLQAIAAYCAALEIYPLSFFPHQYGKTQYGLATVLQAHAMALQNELTELYLMRAIGSYGEALKVFTQLSDPLMWARIQTNLGAIYATHAEIDGTSSVQEDRKTAITYFENAATVFDAEGYGDQVKVCRQAIESIMGKLTD
ncbi:helix-turn-helix transcriptional regulator [uncultured Hyphomonas sp.]|uniref:helix-turn-helix domain-containing protein n=1 Tax=uncultured Hyphomonas sp. TaxID=225298 RepID=UPI0030D70427